MKKTKKVIALVCAVSLLFGVTACKKNDKTAADGDVTSIKWYIPISAQSDMQSVMDAAAEITVPLIGAKLDLQCIDSSAFKERMNMNMASGDTYDLAFVGYINPYLQAVRKGGLMDITDIIDKETPDLKASLPDYAWEVSKVNDKIYAVPNLQSYALPNALLFLKKYCDKYGFNPDEMTSMNDLEPYLAKIKEGEPNVYPYTPSYHTDMWTGDVYEIIEAGVSIKADGSSPDVFLIYDTPEWQEAVNTLHSWYEKGYIRSDYLSVGSDAADVKAGKYAVNNSGWTPGCEVTAKINNGNNEVIIKPMTTPLMIRKKATDTMIGVGANSKNPEKAVKMIELMNTNKELYNLICYGIEGKHYTTDSEGKFEINQDGGYVTNSAWMFGNQFNAMLQQGQEDNIWEETLKLNDEAIKSPLLGFALDTDPIKNEISQISAVNSEFGIGIFIVNGLESFDTYKKKLEAAGIQKVMDEIQKQVNEYWNTHNK